MNREAIDEAIEVLNRIHRTNPLALSQLIAHRVVCNPQLAYDPTVQVGVVEVDEDSVRYEVGLLGIINGLFGVDDRGFGFISAYCDENGEITHFGWTKEDDAPIADSQPR